MDKLSKAQQRAVEQARRELRKVFETVYNMYDDPADMRNALLDLVPAIAAKYGDMGSVAAGEWYEQMRAKWFKDQMDIDTTYQPDDKAMQKTIRRLAGHLWDGKDGSPADPDAMLRGLLANMDKWVKAGGRGVIEKAVKRDPRKPLFARVPQGAKTCAFCAMLAGRGFVYSSAEAAGAMKQYHNDCDCVPVASWDKSNPKVKGYDDERFEKRYMEARRMLEDGTVPEELREGLLKIKPYLEPKHKKSWYGPEDPNNVNSITYLMRHLHPDEYTDLVLEAPDFDVAKGDFGKLLGDDHAKSLNDLFGKSKNQGAAKLWASYAGKFKFDDKPLRSGRVAHFNPGTGLISINSSMIGVNRLGHGQYGAIIHEGSHAIDYLLGKGGVPYSAAYEDGRYGKTLTADAVALLASRMDNRQEGDYLERTSGALSDLSVDVYAVGGEHSLATHDMIQAGVNDYMAGLGDLYKFYSKAGHAPGYYGSKNRPYAQVSEAFAEMLTAQIADEESWMLIQRYFPNAANLFSEMIKDVR